MGTPGERYRDKQLLAQLPKQDLALTYCKHVALEHHNSYEDFVSARNEIALDIGKFHLVITFTSIYKAQKLPT